jgi:hypothetical protein
MRCTNLVFILSADDADYSRLKQKNLRESVKSADTLVKGIIPALGAFAFVSSFCILNSSLAQAVPFWSRPSRLILCQKTYKQIIEPTGRAVEMIFNREPCEIHERNQSIISLFAYLGYFAVNPASFFNGTAQSVSNIPKTWRKNCFFWRDVF